MEVDQESEEKQEQTVQTEGSPNTMEVDEDTKMVDPPRPIPPSWPSALNPRNAPYVVKMAKDALSVRFSGKGNHAHDVGTVRANFCLPADCPIYYFEVKVLDGGFAKTITVGLVSEDFILTRQIGTTATSYGYRGEDGRKYCGQIRGQVYGPMYVTGDVIGCGINFYNNQIFFTKNGKDLGVAFNVSLDAGEYYPAVSLHSPGESVKFNFGVEAFKFDIDTLRMQEKERMETVVSTTSLERPLLLHLVRQYLVHYGLEESVTALDSYGGVGKEESSSGEKSANEKEKPKKIIESKTVGQSSKGVVESKAESKGDSKESKIAVVEQKMEVKEVEKDVASTSLHNRKVIREFIQAGQIPAAISTLERFYPSLLKTRSDVLFRLHCQQFVSLLQDGKEKEAISFARETLSTYSNSENAPSLCATLGLLAYSDISSSPLSYLLDRRHREEVADLVNGAILELDGLSTASGLEVSLRQLLAIRSLSQEQNHNIGLPLPDNLL